MEKRAILLATGNPGKVKEFKDLLSDMPFHIYCLKDLDENFQVIEDGMTFSENAVKKAVQAAKQFQMLSVADDSGLEVDALGGEPGVYSARYAGPEADDEANNDKLLANLAGVPDAQRTARFRCSIAVADPQGNVQTADGVCEGRIGYERRGQNGFGYDPLFYVPEFDQTFAELCLDIKNTISHRARAFQQAKEILRKWI